MLLLRCSLLADSMSRSISFWPSTIATRSSSACVALNSMRFMSCFPGADLRGPGGVQRSGASRAPNSTGGGQGRRTQCRPGRRCEPPCYEESDADIWHRLWAAQLSLHRAVLGSVDRVVRVVAQVIWRLGSRDVLEREVSRCRIRCAYCAPRVLPLHFGHRPVRRL